VFKRVDGTQRPVDFGTVIPGAISVRTTRLRPGEYRLVCTLEGHRQIGMLSTLKVRGG